MENEEENKQTEKVNEVDLPTELNPEEITEVEPKEIKTTEESADEQSTPFESLEKKIDALAKSFDEKLKYDEHKEVLIDRLHTELKTYKDDLILQLLRPVLSDVIGIIEGQKRWNAGLAKKYDEDTLKIEKLLDNLSELPDEWLEVLNRQGVSEYACVQGTEFNGKTQKLIQTVITNEETQHRVVAEKIAPGYEWRGNILKHEQVAVYKYESLTKTTNNGE